MTTTPRPHRPPAGPPRLSEDELQQVAQEVRELLIDTVGEIGGHFGANLGTCEIAVALHSLLDSPRDKILWDVGHQAYPHKVLTGRRDQLDDDPQVRRPGAVLLDRTSPSTTSWAPATPRPRSATRSGSRRRCAAASGEDGHVVAVIGDGAMTGGVAFEAIHQAGGLGTPIVVVLNDNGMSIAPNVGALSRYFNRVRLNPRLWKAREGVEEKPDQAARPASARAFERLGPQLKESIKAFWAPGPVVGGARLGLHGRRSTATTCARCARALREALEAERPVVVHVATVKGKGFAPAEEGGLEGMEKWHAAKPKSIANGAPAPAPKPSRRPSPRRRSTRRCSARRSCASASATSASSASPPR